MQTATRAAVDQEFLRYFRCPQPYAEFLVEKDGAGHPQGFFNFGPDAICYGAASGATATPVVGEMPDVLANVSYEDEVPVLPFDPAEVIANLRMERYVSREPASLAKRAVRQAYYFVRPMLSVAVRRHLQRRWLGDWKQRSFPRWPVETSVDRLLTTLMRLKLRATGESRIPFIWFWPECRQSCAIMTHDVETAVGLADVSKLMDVNDAYGIKSAFQVIPGARYTVTESAVDGMRRRGFEVNVHDWKHDSHLFDTEAHFTEAVKHINAFGRRFSCRGFRSGALYRNQEWYGAFEFAYDMSVPNCGHLEPQHGGCCTVMPYFVGNLLELPVTATQDYSLFHVIGSYSQEIWRDQMEQILREHGLISFIVHPDYLDSDPAWHCYRELLGHLRDLRSSSGLWTALPGEVNDWWRRRDAMQLVRGARGEWTIVGDGAEQARVAYASLDGDRLAYTIS